MPGGICCSLNAQVLTGRESTVEDFSDPLVNPKCIILLNDDRIYVIPVNKKFSDIYHHYFILLFVEKDDILSTTFAASIVSISVVYYSISHYSTAAVALDA